MCLSTFAMLALSTEQQVIDFCTIEASLMSGLFRSGLPNLVGIYHFLFWVCINV